MADRALLISSFFFFFLFAYAQHSSVLFVCVSFRMPVACMLLLSLFLFLFFVRSLIGPQGAPALGRWRSARAALQPRSARGAALQPLPPATR
uniref:Uncharacterized protein n=1 Tax=Zea mays TaxID=4577 RepID=B6T1G2_MAIZE|nr:hypothetical protein [Zea mays]ACG33242.1 hypothetical protein [Zea mays]